MIPIPVEETLAYATLKSQTPHQSSNDGLDLDDFKHQIPNISLKARQNLEL
jgi:hypothetical protein